MPRILESIYPPIAHRHRAPVPVWHRPGHLSQSVGNAKIDPAIRAHTLSEDELATIAKAIQTTEMRPEQTRTDNCVILVEGDLRRR